MNIVAWAKNKLQTEKSQRLLRAISPWIILFFVFVGLLAYVRLFPGFTRYFNAKSVTGVIARAISMFVLALYSFACVISFKIKIRTGWILLFSVLLFANVLTTALSPKAYETAYAAQYYGYGEYFVTSVSNKTIAIAAISGIADFVFAYCLVAVLPKGVIGSKGFYLVFSVFVVFMLGACLYSLLTEKQYYINVIMGAINDRQLTAMFASKQDFGVFLCSAFCLCFFLVLLGRRVFIKKHIRRLLSFFWLAGAFVLFLISLFSLCKTAILGNFVFLVLLLVSVPINFAIKHQRKKMLIFLIAFTIAASVLLTVLFVPPMNQTPLVKAIIKIFDYVLVRSERSAFSRYNILIAYFQQIPLANFFFGMGKGAQDIYVRALAPILVYGLHTGFVIYFANYGLISFMFAAAVVLGTLFSFISAIKRAPYTVVLLVATFFVLLLHSITELEIFLFSSSMTSFFLNFVFFTFGNAFFYEEDAIEVAAHEI